MTIASFKGFVRIAVAGAALLLAVLPAEAQQPEAVAVAEQAALGQRPMTIPRCASSTSTTRLKPYSLSGENGAPDRSRSSPCTYRYVPTNHLYLGDVVICPRNRAFFPDLTVEEGIRTFLTGGMSLPGRIAGTQRGAES